MSMQTDVQSAYAAGSGILVSSKPLRLKSLTVTSGTSSLRNVAACCPICALAGTYSQSSTTITVTSADHGLTNGQRVFFDATSGAARDGCYNITYVDADTFTITSAVSATVSGNCNTYAKIYTEIDTYSTVGLSVVIPGQGIWCKGGLYMGVGPSVTATIFYG
jgi:hypothetical protein